MPPAAQPIALPDSRLDSRHDSRHDSRIAPLRIALAGAGLIGRVHAAAVAAEPAATLVAVVDPAPAGAALAARYDAAHHRSLDELFAAGGPEAAIVATPNVLHVEHALRCLDEGVPILLEKPVAPSVADAMRLVERAPRGPVLVGHHRTHGAVLRRAKAIVDSGALGRVVALTGSALFYKPDTYVEDAPWRTRSGGGPVLINLIHEIHSLRVLCGEIVAVQAMASNAVRGFDVEDTAALLLRFDGGALATFMLSDTAACAQSWEQTSGENPAYAHAPDENCYAVVGTRGTLAVPTLELTRYAADTTPSWWEPFERERKSVPADDPIARQLQHFVRVARGEVEPLVSLADGIANLRVVEAVLRAMREGGDGLGVSVRAGLRRKFGHGAQPAQSGSDDRAQRAPHRRAVIALEHLGGFLQHLGLVLRRGVRQPAQIRETGERDLRLGGIDR